MLDSYCDSLRKKAIFSSGVGAAILSDIEKCTAELYRYGYYTTEQIESGEALHTIMKSRFSDKFFSGKATPDDNFKAVLSNITTCSDKTLNFDKMNAHLVKLLQLINGTLKCEKQKGSVIHIGDTNWVYDDIFHFIGNRWNLKKIKLINRISAKITCWKDFAKGHFSDKNWRNLSKILPLFLIVSFLALSALLLVASHNVVTHSVKPSSSWFGESIFNWAKYDVLGSELPQVTENGVLKAAVPVFVFLLIVCVFLLVLYFSRHVFKRFFDKYRRYYIEISYLDKVFRATDIYMGELQNGRQS